MAKHIGTEWVEAAELSSLAWDDYLLKAVADLFPYTPERGIRPDDWVILVAHVSHANGEPALATAQRLASYVKSYRERFTTEPSPKTLREKDWPYG